MVEFDWHHFFPTSRFPKLKHALWNMRRIRRSRHEAWHVLTSNRSPLEAIVFLCEEFLPEHLADDPHKQEALKFLKALIRKLEDT